MLRLNRMQRELDMLTSAPPPGVTCWTSGDKLDSLEALLEGPAATPYSSGVFKLHISIPERYPLEPPNINFVTPVYHPNIDSSGRICLDILKMPPKGSWSPSLNLSTTLTSIQLLLSEPNPDDPLMADISHEYKHNYQKFCETAAAWTMKHANRSEQVSCPDKENVVLDAGQLKQQRSDARPAENAVNPTAECVQELLSSSDDDDETSSDVIIEASPVAVSKRPLALRPATSKAQCKLSLGAPKAALGKRTHEYLDSGDEAAKKGKN